MQHARFRRLRPALLVPLLAGALAAPAAAQDAGRPGRAGRFGAFLDARFALSVRDMDTATDGFLRALAADPADAGVRREAFLASVLAGRPEAARLASELPGDPAAILMLGDRDAKAGRWDAAASRFAALPASGPTGLLRPLLVAWAQAGARRTDAALATLQAQGAGHAGVFVLHAALIADLAGRRPEAARLYRAATAAYGTPSLRLAQMLGSFQARNGHPDEARRTLDAAIGPGDDLALSAAAMEQGAGRRVVSTPLDGIAEAFLALAGTLQGGDGDALSQLLLSLALDVRPDLTPARLLLADALEVGRHEEAALATLSPVPASDPLIAVARLRRAGLVARLGRTEDALRDLAALAAEHPDRPEPWTAAGNVLRAKNRYAEAADAYAAAIARVPHPVAGDWTLFYQRAVARDRAGQWPGAEADLQRALELQPDQPLVLNYLGYAWAEQGRNLPSARRMVERAVELRPNDGAVVDSLGWVLLRQGDPAGAVRNLERAVELQPEDPTINAHLGDAYWEVGRRREAEFQWRLALVLRPEPAEAARIEARLRAPDVAAAPATAEHRTP